MIYLNFILPYFPIALNVALFLVLSLHLALIIQMIRMSIKVLNQ